eukprot:7303691-Prymnesium_polylepis.1
MEVEAKKWCMLAAASPKKSTVSSGFTSPTHHDLHLPPFFLPRAHTFGPRFTVCTRTQPAPVPGIEIHTVLLVQHDATICFHRRARRSGAPRACPAPDVGCRAKKRCVRPRSGRRNPKK